MAVSEKTVKRLFALSRNQCAHPNCASPIVSDCGTVLGDICHIEAQSPGGPRYNPKQSQIERDSFSNLLLLCNAHHRMIDTDTVKYSSALLYEIKEIHEREGDIELSKNRADMAAKLYAAYQIQISTGDNAQIMIDSPGAIQARDVIFKTIKGRSPSAVPLQGAIGHNLNQRNYVLHLIERFNDFQKSDISKSGDGKFSILYRAIKREFGAKWDFVPSARFAELIAYIQKRILATRLGRIRNSRGEKCFSSWPEWLSGQAGEI